MDYAAVNEFHVLYMKNLTVQIPFSKFHNRKKSLLIIAETLVDKELAAWYGKKRKERKKKEQLRVYWRSKEDWTAYIIQWAQDNIILDVLLNVEIPMIQEDFAGLPEEELREIFKEIDNQNKGDYVELENGQFGIKFKF